MGRGVAQLVGQRHFALGTGLEMGMVGCRRATLRTVIEDDEVGQCVRQLQHVPHPARQPLRCMVQVGYREVTREDGIRIDLNLVAFTPQHGLLFSGLMLAAQETLAAGQRLLVDGGSRRNASLGIELQRDCGLTQRQRARDSISQRRIVGASHVPVTQLPGNKPVYSPAVVHNLLTLPTLSR